jgi:hypothetical protein
LGILYKGRIGNERNFQRGIMHPQSRCICSLQSNQCRTNPIHPGATPSQIQRAAFRCGAALPRQSRRNEQRPARSGTRRPQLAQIVSTRVKPRGSW